MSKFNVYSTQFNYKHGKRMHFPYSIAMLVAYLKQNKKLDDSFDFKKSFIFRDKIDQYINECTDADILLCSCYTWNWEITLHTAKEIKKNNPNCLVIFGGPQVPSLSENFFKNNSFIDILVHGEGELILSNIFQEYLNKKNYLDIKGIETKDFRNSPEQRLDENNLPSPYLTNLIWELVDKNDSESWAVNWETNRGCPYGCTFCDWGYAAFNKTNRYDEEKLYEEIDWFSKNKLTYIECCDANFGIFQERDLLIARKLKESALNTGYPKFFHSAWAKASSDKVIPIAKELQTGGLLRDVTLALQSLDAETLKIVKRANLKFDQFSHLTKAFQDNGIPTYSEIIRGLPGETLESFKNGLEIIMADGNISTLYIYNCAIYVNAPMNNPSYREQYKIKTTKSPLYTSHVIVPENDIVEYEYVVTSTSSFTFDELKEMFYYSWGVLTFNIFGIFDQISNFYNKTYGITHIEFIKLLLDFCQVSTNNFSKEFSIVEKYVKDGFDGVGWNHLDSNLGNIVWPIEEASWLRLTYNKDILEKELNDFIQFVEKTKSYETSSKITTDLIKFQIFLLTTRNAPKIKSDEFQFDWKEYLTTESKLEEKPQHYSYLDKNQESDPIQWAYNAIWFGRATQQFKTIPRDIVSGNILEHPSKKLMKDISLLSP